MALHIVILAAGLGQRMRSTLPKVLHTVAGRSMLERVIDTAQTQAPEKIHVIIGHAADTIQAACQASPVNWITQAEQLGTGHAVLQALPHIPADADVLVLYGDVPLLRAETLAALIKLGQKHQQALAEQQPIVSLSVDNYQDILGVNDRSQLHQVERIWQRRVAEQLLLSGVGIADANRIDIRGTLHCDQDVFIDINTVFKGQVHIGAGSVIGPNCVLSHVTIGAYCKIETASVLENCIIGDNCQIGPFARIRPGTQLAAHCKIGNFVEAKQAIFGEHSKANHLSYLGDVTIGSHVNIGAGTITCNYDGANKHQTIIEDGVNIGSDTQLVAPVTIGKNATIGAGSTIRSNAPPDQLTLSVTQQKTIPGWKRKKKIDKPE